MGAHYDTVTIGTRNAGGAKMALPFYTVTCKIAFVKDIEQSLVTGGDMPLETIRLAVGALQLGYKRQKPDGTFDKEIIAGWNTTTNRAEP
jgi:type VI protein secretion system component Hcp